MSRISPLGDEPEQSYLQAANMSPAKFYPLYLLAKLYDASGQQQKALDMANSILNKEVKVHSTAIEEYFTSNINIDYDSHLFMGKGVK